jgi:hypothetical protein
MSASQARALDAVAFQLAATLDAYDVTFDALMRAWPDMDLYHRASASMDELKMYSAAVPQLSVPYVALLISHAELVHCLWKNGSGTAQPGDPLERARHDHRLAITSLRRKCLHLLAENAQARDTDR